MQNDALSVGAKTKPRHNCAATSVQILLCRSKRTGKALRIKASVAASTMLIFAALFHGLYSSISLASFCYDAARHHSKSLLKHLHHLAKLGMAAMCPTPPESTLLQDYPKPLVRHCHIDDAGPGEYDLS